MSYLIVFSTVSSKKEGLALADLLLSKRLAACVNLLDSPVTSIYRWKGKKAKSKEQLLMIKTRRSLFKKLEAALRKVHSYDVPEIVAVPIVKGSSKYLDWVGQETRPSP